MATITLLSDSHGQHRKIPKEWLPETDWILHAGDVSSMGTLEQISDFLDWFSKVGNYKFRVFCAGNHDWLFERTSYLAKSMIPDNVIYLENSEVVIDGIKVYGVPQQIEFCNWAFNIPKEDMKKYWDAVPEDTNVILTHGAPFKILDMTLEGDFTGCEYLLKRMSELKQLKLEVHGHIHEARGIFEFADGVKIINASILNRSYKMVNKPYIIDTNGWKII